MEKTCYYCKAPSKTLEHVPPKCLFPKGTKKNYRVNLMKVPSCDLHNSNKSGDDQYMMVYFAARAKGLDYEKLRPHIDKTIRTIIRKPHFLREYTDQITITTEVDSQARTSGIDWYDPKNHVELKSNYERIGNFLAAVARGALFYDKGVQWSGAVFVMPHFLGTLETDGGVSLTKVNELLINPDFSTGDNQEIFFYRTESHEGGKIAHVVDMCFYNEMKATCLFMPREMRSQIEEQFGTVNFVRWVDCEPRA
ncbi:hypothetical protein SAMN04490182_4343 [Pseudomonas cedrina]|uniref:HNH endonuclease n=1 Tax=Pseudomonas cedrina TaxID=651740 RepID=A0ABY0UYE2_PSECE|nr:hypothetical protein [Pseudomonas cedrina]SDT37414.1 hypothetical protein SAMN04490182_4343 [Pseudomonas cedrina]